MFMALFYALMTGMLVFVGFLFAGADGIRADLFTALLCWGAAYATFNLFIGELREMDNEYQGSDSDIQS